MGTVLKPLVARMRRKMHGPVPKAGNVGFRSDQRNGWFNDETGELASGFPICSEDTFIDVGCGDGGVSVFAGNQGASVIATDISQECVDKTLGRLKRTKAKSFRGEASDTNPLPVESNTCTRIACLEVLEHVADPSQVIEELKRVATPGALFLLAVPDPASEAVQKDLAPEAYWKHPNHIRVFERAAFADLVQNAGLTIVNRSYKSFFWAMWWTLFWAAEQEFGAQEKPVLAHWSQTWNALMDCPGGDKIANRLDMVMPKSQVIVAQKPI